LTAIFDSEPLNLFLGGVGEFTFNDEVLGELNFVGAGALLSIQMPSGKLGLDVDPIEVRFAETYVPSGSTTSVNVFDDGVRASIDDEEWQWREVLLHVFWRDKDGSILCREQVGRRVIDRFAVEVDKDGNPVRVAVLELP